VEAVRKCEKEIKGLKSELSDSKKQSTKALKKVEALEREMRQIKAALEGREAGSGASFKPRLSDEGDIRQQVEISLDVC
jgi:chromosome segregation ATPase